MHIDDDLMESYDRDGVVIVRNLFASHWVESLSRGVDQAVDAPGPMSRYYADGRDQDWYFYDTLNWARIDAFRRFAFESDAAALAGRLMGCDEVRLLNDIIFYRGPGTQLQTPFHQDLPYLCFDTKQFVSLWMPLVPVSKKSALAFVPGSHRWPQAFGRPAFSTLDHNNPDDVESYHPIPDINAEPARFGVVSWDMAPGDCVMFHGLTLHGGSGRLEPDTPLKVFGINWLGDQTRFRTVAGGADPDFRGICAVNGISDGDSIDCDSFPITWKRSA